MLSVTNIKASTCEIKKVSSLTGCAMLTAIKAVIAQFTIAVSNLLEIGFSGIVVGATGMFYGPWLSGIAGVIADTLEFLLRPSGPYFPGFAINEFVIAFIYGCFFYKQEITWKRVLYAQLLVMLIVNMCLTPLWLNILYGKTFWALFSVRIIPQLVKFPIDFFLLYTLLKTLSKIKRK
ncbi:MAG: folate family ECF transporter S component [Erysipelotrichia bacterium]|nr:folate family ECF transporter S component [Erysipelotrichia bacterium]NCC54828.1 folate family ECF transporter S component [Erysipelotrichia bacterium]